jgi:hypothetical protein
VVDRAVAVAREYATLPQHVMRRTRDVVRADLVALFGAPSQDAASAAEFAAQADSVWWTDATRARLTALFARAK